MELKGGEVIWSWQSWPLSKSTSNIPSVRVNQQLVGPKALSWSGEEVSARQVGRDRCRVGVCVCERLTSEDAGRAGRPTAPP